MPHLVYTNELVCIAIVNLHVVYFHILYGLARSSYTETIPIYLDELFMYTTITYIYRAYASSKH